MAAALGGPPTAVCLFCPPAPLTRRLVRQNFEKIQGANRRRRGTQKLTPKGSQSVPRPRLNGGAPQPPAAQPAPAASRLNFGGSWATSGVGQTQTVLDTSNCCWPAHWGGFAANAFARASAIWGDSPQRSVLAANAPRQGDGAGRPYPRLHCGAPPHGARASIHEATNDSLLLAQPLVSRVRSWAQPPIHSSTAHWSAQSSGISDRFRSDGKRGNDKSSASRRVSTKVSGRPTPLRAAPTLAYLWARDVWRSAGGGAAGAG